MKTSTIPHIIYGTAWKEESTSELVQKAVLTGFRAIDTANQKKHYREDYVGAALLKLESQGISRSDLFLQSKYTYQQGQDHRLPYDPKSDFATQVKASFASSLKNLHTDYLDSYLLHGPSSGYALTPADWEVWGAIESLLESNQTRLIGVSNVGLHHLTELCAKAKIKPQIVQNRCFAVRGWDQEVREYCVANQIIYQGFSLLTANQPILFHPQIAAIAQRLQVTTPQLIFRFASQIGILPLTGTTDRQHMKEDLEIEKICLSAADIQTIHSITD